MYPETDPKLLTAPEFICLGSPDDGKALGNAYVMEGLLTVCLELDSRPECLTLVRGMLAGVAELHEFDSELLSDLKTAVSEACNNVVVHAYDGETGPLRVNLEVREDSVEVKVCDRGGGMRSIASSEERMGVGLAVISALANRAEFINAPEGGTEVRMTFTAPGAIQLPCPPAAQEAAENWAAELSGDAVVTLSPVTLVSAVLGRLARALAASAGFSLDRFSDVYLVTDAIAAHAENAASGGRIAFALAAEERLLELTIGPFQPGAGAQFENASDRPGTPLALLADEIAVEELIDHSELLRVVLRDRHGDRPPAD